MAKTATAPGSDDVDPNRSTSPPTPVVIELRHLMTLFNLKMIVFDHILTQIRHIWQLSDPVEEPAL
jgi:hypothetical protein